MQKIKIITAALAILVSVNSNGQTLKLDAIIDSIRNSHPAVKMYENEIRSMDEAAKGAKGWMPA